VSDHVSAASSLRMRAFIRLIWAWVARISVNRAALLPSRRVTMAVSTVMSSRRLPISLRTRSICRARNARSMSSAILATIAKSQWQSSFAERRAA
jgi:hypothetical protein